MNYEEILPSSVLHWNYRGLTEFPTQLLNGEESDVTDIYLKENMISHLPNDIGMLVHLESLYISGNDITELPKDISNLKCLKCLDVSGNRLQRLPNEIGDVVNLKFLILDENELTQLPLRLSELRFLRYLSVCDNKLKWLPQRPVYNYHHCELRFWRNPHLKSLPYSLWYHMFRDQQTRSLNIACLKGSSTRTARGQTCRLKFCQDSVEWYCDIDVLPQYSNILENGNNNPPTLFEICKRNIYKSISEAARKASVECYNMNSNYRCYSTENNNLINLSYTFDNFNISDRKTCDVNTKKVEKKVNYVPRDIIEEHYSFLPNFVKEDLINGPISKCENASCKKPVFDYVHLEFTLGKLILIDNIQEVILSASFCSKACADLWKAGSVKTIPWTLL